MRPWSPEYAGRLVTTSIESPALASNPLGDPSERPLWVYLPPAYDEDPNRRFPTIYVLQGFGGFVSTWGNRRAFELSLPELVDRHFSTAEIRPCVVVYVDAWTRLGGSQFLDSPGTGNYQTYLSVDVVDFVDANFRTLASREHRALEGISSGGYGAMVGAMCRPEVFGAFASHAGDGAYELSYMPEIANAHRALRDRYGGSLDAFLDELAAAPGGPTADPALTIVYACAACYSANDDGTVELPFDPRNGRLREDVWARWLAWDPVRMVAQRRDALLSLRGIYLDAGRADDYHLDIAAERFVAELAAIGITDVAFELFDGGHRGLERRYPPALTYLAERISPR